MANNNRYLQSSGLLRDWTHASRVVRSNGYALQPKYEHLFHVVFNFTPAVSQLFSTQEKMEFPLLVKDVDLPSYTIDTADHNQYNRRTHSQHRITYTPVTLTFHDDASERINKLWYAYYTWYYKDSTYDLDSGAYSTIDKYDTQNNSGVWGLIEGAPRFFQDIRIYSFLQKRFIEYTLINPMISDFRHGRHSREGTGIMENAMTVNYETVKYATGAVNGENIKHFTENLYYDPTPSPIATAEGRQVGLINGQIIDIAEDILIDLARDGELSGSVDRLIDRAAQGLTTGNRTVDSVIRAVRDAALNARRSGDFGDIIPDTKENLRRIARREGVNIIRDVADVVRSTPAPTTTTTGPNPNIVRSNRSSVYNPAFTNNVSDNTDTNRGNSWVVPLSSGTKASPNRISDVAVVDRSEREPIEKKNKRLELLRLLERYKSRALTLGPNDQSFSFVVRSHARVAEQFRNLFPSDISRNADLLELGIDINLRNTNQDLQ